MFRKFVFILLFAGSYAFLWDSKTKLHCIFSKYMLNYFELNESYFLSNVQQNSKRIYDHLSLEKYGENLQKQGIIVMAMLDELRNQKYPKIADDLMTVNLYINNITGNIMLYSTDRSEQGNELAADDSRIRIGFSNVYKMIIEELKLFYYSECKQKFGTCLTKIDSRFEKLRVESKELKTLKESSSPSTISDYLDVMVKNAEEAFKTNIEDKTYEDFHPSNMVLLKLMNDSSKDDEVFFPDNPLEHLKYVNINEEYNVFLFSLFEKIKSSFHVSSLKSYQQQVIAAALYPIFSCTSSYVRMFKQLYITKKGGKYATEINKLGNKLIKIFGKLFNKSFLPFKVGKYIHDITEKLLYIASYYSLQQSGMTVNWINFFLSLLSKPMKLNRIVYDSSTTVLDKISKLQCEILIEETESKIRDTLEYTKALIRNVDPFVILRRSVNHEDMFQKGPLDVLNTPTIRTIYYNKYISAEECSNISNRPSRQASNMGKDLTIGLAGALPFEVTIPDISINIIRRPSSASENERRKTRDENMGGSSLGIIDSNIHAGRSPNVSVDQPSRRSTFKGKKRIDPTLDGMPSTSTIIPKSSRDDGLEKMDGSDDDEYNRIQSLIISEKNKNEPTAGNARRVGTRSDDDQYPNSRSKNIKLKGKLEFDESIDDDSSNASEIFETAERDLMLDEIKKAYQELKKSHQHDYDRRTQSDSEIMKGQEIRRETKKSWYIESSETFDGENTSYKTHKIKYTSRETSGNNSSNKPNTPVSAEDLLHELETRNIPADHTRDRDESPRSIDSTEQKKPISPQLSGEKESEKNKKRRPIIDLNKSAKWSEIIQEDDQQYENYPGSSSRSNEQNYKEMRADSDGKDGNEITDADDKKGDILQEPHKVKNFKNILEQKIAALSKSIEEESSSKEGKKKIDPRSSDELDGIRRNSRERGSVDSTEQKKPLSPRSSGETESEKNKCQPTTKDLPTKSSAELMKKIQEDDQQLENYPRSSGRSNKQNYQEMRADSDRKDGNEITDADDEKDDILQEPHKVKNFKNILEQKISALPKSIEGESSSKKGKKKIDPRSSDELDGKKTIDSKHRSRRASIDGESLPRQHLSSPKSSGKRKIDSLSSDELDGLGLNNRERGSVDSTEQKKPMSPRSSGETESEKNERQYTTKDLPTRRSAELLKKIQEDDQQFENYPRKPSINNEQNYREMRADSDRKEGNEINDADDIQQEPHKVKTFKNIFEQKIAALSQSIEEESSSKKGKKKIDPRSSDELDGKQPIDSKHLSRRMSIDWESLPRQFPLSPKTSRNDKTLEDSLRLYENRSRQSSKNIGPFATPIKKDDERLHKKKSEINYEHGKTNLKNQRDLGDHHSENSFHSENYSNRRPYIRKHDGDSTSLHCLFSEYLLGYLDLNERYFVAIHKNNDANLTYYDTNLRFLSEFILAMLDELRNYNKNPFAFDLMTINLYLNNLANDLSIISSDITTMQFNDAESHRHKLVVNYDIMTKGLFNFLRSNCLSYSPDAFETRFQDVYQTVRALDEKKAVKNARILMWELQKLKFRAYASWKPTLDRDQHDDFHPTNMLFYDLMSGYLKRDESAKPTRKVLDFRRKRHADSAKFDDGLQAIRDVVISTSRRGGSHNNIIAAFYCVSLNFNAEYVTSFQQQVLAATIHPVFSCIAEYITAFKNILYVFKHDATHVNDIVEFGVVLSETFGKFIHLNLFSNKVSVYLEKVLRRLRDVIHSKNKEMITEILSLCKKPMELNRLEFGRDKNVIETIVQEKERKLLAHTNALVLSTVAYVEALSTHRHIFDVIKRSVPHNDMFETEPLDVFRACDSGYETDE